MSQFLGDLHRLELPPIQPMAPSAEIVPLNGSFIPFPATRADKDQTKDPRQSIEERYPSRDAYLAKVKEAAMNLVKERYVLPGDVDAIVAHAGVVWDNVTAGPLKSEKVTHRNAKRPGLLAEAGAFLFLARRSVGNENAIHDLDNSVRLIHVADGDFRGAAAFFVHYQDVVCPSCWPSTYAAADSLQMRPYRGLP